MLAKISYKAYLINNLIAKLLISTDILVFKKVNIIIFKKTSYIKSCKIDIKLKATPKKGIAKSLIYVIARITILLFAFIAILIYYIIIAKDKDLLFEPDDTLITLFIQLANKDIKLILAKNNLNKLVFLLQNFRFKNLIDIDYNNRFLVLNANIIKLITQILKISPLQILIDYSDEARLLKFKYYISAIIYKDFSIT